jgi:hypothetical protein
MLYCAYVYRQLFISVIYCSMIINRYLLCVIQLLFDQYCAISDPELCSVISIPFKYLLYETCHLLTITIIKSSQ